MAEKEGFELPNTNGRATVSQNYTPISGKIPHYQQIENCIYFLQREKLREKDL